MKKRKNFFLELENRFKNRIIDNKTLDIFAHSNENFIFTERFILIDVTEFNKMTEDIVDSKYIKTNILFCQDEKEYDQYFHFKTSDPKIELITHNYEAVQSRLTYSTHIRNANVKSFF